MTPEQLEKRFRRAEKTLCSTKRYKVYSALLTQSGADNGPSAVVLENGIGNIVWTYQTFGAFGRYVGTLVGAFPADKTWLSITPTQNPIESFFSIERVDDDQIVVSTANGGGSGFIDDVLLNTPIEIRVYKCAGTVVDATTTTTTTTTSTTTTTTVP